jgi:hypothetical protein
MDRAMSKITVSEWLREWPARPVQLHTTTTMVRCEVTDVARSARFEREPLSGSFDRQDGGAQMARQQRWPI